MLILASDSPRRKQLMSFGGWDFNVLPADIDESPRPNELPSEYVMRMALEKANFIAEVTDAENIIVAADTTVADGKDIMGKPTDEDEAKMMLVRLRNRVHQVYTAIAVARFSDGFKETALCITDVPMRNYSEQEIADYVDSGDPFDKAGGYAIQHSGFKPVKSLEGCYANVMGLPICHLGYILRGLGQPAQVEIVSKCQNEFDYHCAIQPFIMEGKL